jgi:hypothetical protein
MLFGRLESIRIRLNIPSSIIVSRQPNLKASAALRSILQDHFPFPSRIDVCGGYSAAKLGAQSG